EARGTGAARPVVNHHGTRPKLSELAQAGPALDAEPPDSRAHSPQVRPGQGGPFPGHQPALRARSRAITPNRPHGRAARLLKNSVPVGTAAEGMVACGQPAPTGEPGGR